MKITITANSDNAARVLRKIAVDGKQRGTKLLLIIKKPIRLVITFNRLLSRMFNNDAARETMKGRAVSQMEEAGVLKKEFVVEVV